MLRYKVILFCLFIAGTHELAAQHPAEWMQKSRWGIMVHYLADWRARTDSLSMDTVKWNELIDSFDAETLAKQIDSTGAGYLIFTIGQNSGYYLSPNQVYYRLTGNRNRCSKRDLIADLSVELKKRNIRLIVYLPSGAPAGDSLARKALEWQNGPHPNPAFQLKWEEVIREWSLRWKNKIDGWWFDGCYWPNIMYRSEKTPNFMSFAAAAKAGNPSAIVAFCSGVVYRVLSLTPYEDYTAGENDKPELISIRRDYNGLVDGKQIHVLSFLGRTWGMGESRFTQEQIISWSKQVTAVKGAITWDTPVQKNGTIADPFMKQLVMLGKSL
jgi:hypothetical protein